MRNRILFLAALLTLMACQRETTGEEPVVKTFDCFTVSVEETEMTKAHMEDGGVVKWDVGDCIGIYSDTQAPVKYTRGEDGKFYGEPVTGTQFYAFYPFDGFVYNTSSPLVLHFDNGEVAFDNNHTSLRTPIVANSKDNVLSFKQTSALLRFSITGSGLLQSVTLKGKNEEKVGGDCSIDMSKDSPVLSLAQGASEIAYVLDGPAQLSSEAPFEVFFVVPPITFNNGLSLELTIDDIVITKESSSEIVLNRAVMKSLSEINSAAELIRKDRDALVAFYNALDGPNWTINTNWCSDKPIEEWYGVRTDPNNGRVIVIELLNNKLQGTIPVEIGNLDHLSRLSLSNGDSDAYLLRGPLPDSMRNLKELSMLDIRCDLSSPIPDWLGELESLSYLSLQQCKLTGSIPDEVLDLDLTTLCLDGNQLSGPLPDFSKMKRLYELSLSDNHFTAEIPESFQQLKQLERLGLNNNDLSGEVLIDFSQFPDLCYIGLENNNFTGALPLISGSNLYYLYLNGNHFSGTIPSCYSTLMDSPQLLDMWLYDNELSGPLPSEITNHPLFSEFVDQFLRPQKQGFKVELDETKVPACRHIYDTYDGGKMDLEEQYGKADYTMIVRWTEWCNFSRDFLPQAMTLARTYENMGLQTLWAYGGGDGQARQAYLKESGLDQFPNHFIEVAGNSFNIPGDHAIWIECAFVTPFVEIVDKNGYICFIDDSVKKYTKYSFSYQRSDLELYLKQLLGGEELYTSTDYSADGTVHTLQTASVGAGIDLVLMGDAFSDRLIADGTYEGVMNKAMNAFFSEEPYKSLKNRFNVYYVDVVSKNEVYYGKTALNTYYGDGSRVGGDDDKVFEYAGRVLSDSRMDDAVIVVMMNRDYYAGTCYMYSIPDGDYGRGVSISYFPASSDVETFNGLVTHEAGGHGFAKLDDEYAYESQGAIPSDVVESHKALWGYGWWKNTDYTSDVTQVKWSKFISDERYASEKLGVYEGGGTYWTGVWRPTEDSIMRYNVGGFNAPSREAIYYKAMKLSEGAGWEYDYETFVTFDMSTRTTPTATTSAQSRPRNYVERLLPPLPPPVVVNKDWREVRK